MLSRIFLDDMAPIVWTFVPAGLTYSIVRSSASNEEIRKFS